MNGVDCTERLKERVLLFLGAGCPFLPLLKFLFTFLLSAYFTRVLLPYIILSSDSVIFTLWERNRSKHRTANIPREKEQEPLFFLFPISFLLCWLLDLTMQATSLYFLPSYKTSQTEPSTTSTVMHFQVLFHRGAILVIVWGRIREILHTVVMLNTHKEKRRGRERQEHLNNIANNNRTKITQALPVFRSYQVLT